MAAPYFHSLPPLTREPVSSTSVNATDYSKMMRKAGGLVAGSADSEQLPYYQLPPLRAQKGGGAGKDNLTALPEEGAG